MAISEAVEDAATRDDTKYALGSVLNHVMLHQTVIGLEAQEQMAMAGEEPDVIIACAGGGSNFSGLTFPFVGRMLRGEGSYRVIAAEPEAAPSLTRGIYAYDFGDTGKMAPIVKMHTLGSEFMPEPIHAGGLRYHGMSPLVSLLKEEGLIEARSVHQRACFEVGVQFARAEGILRRPRARTRSRSSWTRPSRRRLPARPASSCSTCPVTVTSTWRRTSATFRDPSRTTSTRRRKVARRWRRCSRWADGRVHIALLGLGLIGGSIARALAADRDAGGEAGPRPPGGRLDARRRGPSPRAGRGRDRRPRR